MGQAKKILIIDDEKIFRQKMHGLLVANRFVTRLADDGLSAISLFQSWQPDLVLLDLVMPEIDGFVVCQALRNLSSGKNIPIVIVTAATDDESIRRSFEVGATDVIFKPINENLFLHRISAYLSTSRHLKQLENDMKNYRNVLRLSGLGCWQWKIGSNRLEISEELQQILDLGDVTQFSTYQDFMDIIHVDDKARVDLCFWQSLREKSPFIIEHRFIRNDGREISVLHHGEIVTDDYGNPWGIIGTIQDLTTRKENEDKLLLLKQAIEVLPIGVTISDLDGRVLYVNHVEALMHGYQPEELIGQTASEMAPDHLRQDFLLERFEQTGTWKRESVNLRKNGTEFPVQLASILVRNDDGKPIGVVTSCEEITERKKVEEEIEKKAFFDGLTGLPNRNMFNNRLFKALIEAKRDKTRLALLFIDMDNLKSVNDKYGHEIGDELLKQFSRRIDRRMRDADTFARLGGDEFVLLLKSKNGPCVGSVKAAERILESLKDPFVVNGELVECGVSIGISFYPEDGKFPEQLVHSADMAMYKAKANGGCQYFLASETSPADNAFEKSLEHALENNALRLLCQPEVEVETGRLIGISLLSYWKCPDLGIVDASAVWQPVATNRLYRFNEWFLKELGSWVHDTRRLLDSDFSFSVPLHYFPCREENFVAEFTAFTARTGLKPSQFEFRLTVQLALQEGDLKPLIEELKKAGFRVCIDGGTEYLAAVKIAQTGLIDKIKVDLNGIGDQPEKLLELEKLKKYYHLSASGKFVQSGSGNASDVREVIRSRYENILDSMYIDKKKDIRKVVPILDMSSLTLKTDRPAKKPEDPHDRNFL